MAKQKALRSVKCYYCNKEVDRTLGFGYRQLPNKRWAHDNCAESHAKKENPDNKIHKKMKELLGDGYVKTKIDKQIKEYKQEGKTSENILKALEYWYDIKKNSVEQANGGIGIVGYIYKDALEYFNNKERIQKQTNEISPEIIDNIVAQQNRESGVSIKKENLKKPRKKLYFRLD